MAPPRDTDTPSARSDLPTTQWTLVMAAGNPALPESRAALVSLCETYWYPLYAYVRRRGNSADEALDLTQEFLVRIIEGRYLDRADPEKGRFRSFILTSLKFFLADEADRRHAQKRGGTGKVLPFEVSSCEDNYQREPSHQETPERIFQRRWAYSLLDRVVTRLREEFVEQGRLEQFNRLRVFLLGGSEVPYAKLASELGTTEGALKVSIHRLRKRYRELFRLEIAETVMDPAEVESELRFLAAALRRQ